MDLAENVYVVTKYVTFVVIVQQLADPSGREVEGEGLRPLACWDCGFESRWRHGCLSVVNVVCCQVEVSATGRSLVQRSPSGCGVSLCVIYKPRARGGPGQRWAVARALLRRHTSVRLHIQCRRFNLVVLRL